MEAEDTSLQLDGYSYVAGAYNPFGNVMSFPAYRLEKLWGRKLKYHLTDTEFRENAKLIERLLAYHHEFTHLYQTMGTLNGYFLYECLLIAATLIFTVCEKVKYELPLKRFITSGQPGQNMRTEYPEYYYNFIRGFFYKFLVDWNQGSHQPYLLPIPTELKPKTAVSFVKRSVPFVNDTFDKILGITPKSLPQVFILCNKETYTMFLGSFSIMEAFAKSVEFEHLMWFNKDVCEKYWNGLNSQPENLIYTLPILLFFSQIPPEYHQSMKFDFAVFRIICDIALMNQDSLLDDYNTDYTLTLNDEPNLAIRTHPGDTFLRALEALPRVPPLKGPNEDVLRFYDNLCEEIGIPSHDEMVERGIKAIENRCDRFTNDWLNKLCKNYLKVMLLRKKHALFFINDLIYADKSREMAKEFGDLVYYVDTGKTMLTQAKEPNSAPTVALMADILIQLLQDKTVSCNYERLFGGCKKKGTECFNMFPGKNVLSQKDCVYFQLIKPIYKNAICSEQQDG